jgi:peroxiredoxin
MVRTFTLAFLVAVTSVASAETTKREAKAPEVAEREQAAVASTPAVEAVAAKVGAPAPDFTLTDTDGKTHALAKYVESGKIVVLEWFNPDCPFVKKHHEKNKTMANTFGAYKGKDVVWLAINSGAAGKQGNGLERNQKARADYGVPYPILLDETGSVGRLYGAKTTPHMFVIQGGTLVYAGAIDDNASAGTLGETNYVANAVDAVLAGKAVEMADTKSYGCSVKYGATLP